MARFCKVVIIVFAILYLLALGMLLIGTFGLFGQEQDPLSAVFLVPLGLPWNLYLDGFADDIRAWLAALTPALNLILLWLVCRIFSRRGG